VVLVILTDVQFQLSILTSYNVPALLYTACTIDREAISLRLGAPESP